MVLRKLACLCLFASFPLLGNAQPPAPKEAAENLTQLLRPLLLDSIPPVLYEGKSNWGKQTLVSHIHWKGLKPTIVKAPRNDGVWRKCQVTPRALAGNFVLHLSDLKAVNADTQTFKIYLSFPINMEMEQQNWESGVRLYSGGVKARLKIHLGLDCESTLKLDTSTSLLPDAVFRLRVTKANLWYNELAVEHIAGVGGAAAQIIGDTIHDAVKQWRPSLERKMLDKANAAIVKAADTKEVKLSLGSWLGGK